MLDATTTPLAIPTTDDLMDPATLAGIAFLGQFTNAGTRDQYQRDLRLWFAWCASHRIPPLAAQRAHLQAYVVHLKEQRGNAAATVVRRMGTLSGYYGVAVLDGYLDHTPYHHVRLPKVVEDPAKRSWLNRFELGALLRVARASKKPADWALIALMGTVGMRVSAVCDIRIEDLSTTPEGYQVLRSVGKGGKISQKALPIPVVQAVEAARAGRTSGWLLLRRDGSQMTRRSADRVVQRLAQQAGIERKISPHSLRRSFATLSLQAGVDIRVVQAGMDHSSTRTTLGYDGLGVELHGQAAHTMAALLASAS